MAVKNNADIFLAIVAIATASFFGWLIFSGFNSLFPALEALSPIWKLVIGFGGLWILVKLGIRKLG